MVSQDYEAAVFEDLGSSPATLESSRACDMYGCAPGNDCETADAEQAYAQSLLTGTETWVCLPPEARLGKVWNIPEVQKMKRPVVRLRLALYGHPDFGTYWERHCDAQWQNIRPHPRNTDFSIQNPVTCFTLVY